MIRNILATIPALSFLAGPLMAQDLPFSAEGTESCLAAAELPSEMSECIGTSAQACIDTPDGYTTVGMGFCLGYERDYWDARLNTAYGTLMAEEKDLDKEMREIGATVPSMSEALRDMQRAWIVFRDASCDYELSQWGGGTGGGPAVVNCQMIMTGEQALRLEARLEEKRVQ